MKKILAATAILTIAATFAASAMDDPIAKRKAVMKQTGGAVGTLAKMVKGEADYDATAAQDAMRTIQASATGFENFFPAGSETGGETTAAPKIWEDMAGFKAAAEKLAADAGGAIEAAGGGLDSLKGVFGGVAGNCKSCHETYRVKKG